MRKPLAIALLSIVTLAQSAWAQAPSAPAPAGVQGKPTGHEMYLAWGYNGDGYRAADLHMSQPGLNNDFILHGVDFRDSKGWTDGLFEHALTVPQYNLQYGFFIKKNTALEFNYTHPKAIVRTGQTVRITGKLDGQQVDKDLVLTPDVLKYQLNNGANFALFMIVQRFPLFRESGKTGSVMVLAKGGIGVQAPHTENVVFGQPNDPGFQFTGPNVGGEVSVRLHIFRWIYTEFGEKGVIAHYGDLNINEGKADQPLWAHSTSLIFGLNFRVGG